MAAVSRWGVDEVRRGIRVGIIHILLRTDIKRITITFRCLNVLFTLHNHPLLWQRVTRCKNKATWLCNIAHEKVECTPWALHLLQLYVDSRISLISVVEMKSEKSCKLLQIGMDVVLVDIAHYH